MSEIFFRSYKLRLLRCTSLPLPLLLRLPTTLPTNTLSTRLSPTFSPPLKSVATSKSSLPVLSSAQVI
ncbi:hypothetical protein L484_006055 [Morus notabilis]|uniref:Uncharacterized protein n=1 Tax=Morus notabilis TaxID=981085 RepID=W9R4D5_9ROSA|nr:hypothetical protein L484_006055 [Morus notabilis]